MVPLQKNVNADSMRFALCSGVSLLWHLPGAQFSQEQVFRENFVQQGVNMWEITAKFRYCEATILHNEFPHKLRKVVRNDGWPDTALLIMHMLSTCCKLSAPATHHLLAHDVRPIDLAQLRMNFDRRYAVCIQNFYHRPHFTVCVSWNKRRHLQPLKRCYMRTLEVSLLHASCYIITLSRTRTRFKQLIVY